MQVTINKQVVDFDAAVILMDADIREALHSEFNDALVLCQSSDGWSYHAAGSTDEDISTGDAPNNLTGPGRPTAADLEAARAQAFVDQYCDRHKAAFGATFTVN